MHPLRPEFHLIALACRARLDARALEPLTAFIENTPLDWEAVLELATLNKVRPSVYQSLRQTGSPQLPAELMERWKVLCQQIAWFNLDNAREQLRLLRGLQAAGLTAIPYRGPYMGIKVYGDPGLRETTDIDLFIRLEELPRLKEALRGLGYVPSKAFTPAQERDHLARGYEYKFDHKAGEEVLFHLEAHWMAADWRYAMTTQLADVEAHLIDSELNGLPVRAFSPEMLFLQLIMHHGGWEQWRYFKFVCDLAHLVQAPGLSFDWDVMLAEARRLGLLGLCYNGLALADALLGIALPPAVAQEVRKAKYQRLLPAQIQVLEQGWRRPSPSEAESPQMVFRFYRRMLGYHLQVRERWSDRWLIRWRFLQQVLLPNQAQIEASGLKYPWYYLLILARPFWLLRRHLGG